MTQRPTGWRYLELSYAAPDRSDIRLDGVPTTDGASVATLMARLGEEGWELVESGSGADARQVMWFKRPIPLMESAPADAPPALFRVVLVNIGPSRIDPHRRSQLISVISELTGQSGWRAARVVDKVPRTVIEGVSAAEADRIRAALEAIGGTVEVS